MMSPFWEHPQQQGGRCGEVRANAFSEDAVRSKASGMNGHITKPVDPDTLYAELAKILLNA